jgi:uncharacterized protein involved in exopolysaccharide biosynthesis
MNYAQTAERKPNSNLTDRDVGFLDLIIILAKNKKKVIGLPIAAAFIASCISLTLPNFYKATAKLLPPQQSQSGAAAILSQLGGAAGLVPGAAGLKNPNDVYVAILKSRTVADRIIGRFKLKEVYETTSLERARKDLAEDTAIVSGKDGLITVEVEAKSSKLAAEMTNAYVDELMKMTRELAVTEAGQRRVFFEQQLEMSKNNLANAEATLKSNLDKKGVVSVDGQSRAIVETMGRLRAQISAKEIQLNSLRAFVTPTHPDFRRTEEELSSLRAELLKLENGSQVDNNSQGSGTGASDKGAGLENIKTLRDVKYHQMLYELLAKQYEVARLDEAKDPSVVQVLDAAVQPEKKIKPRRSLIVLLTSILALFSGICWAFIAEAKARAFRTPETAARWLELQSCLSVRFAKKR